MIELKLPLCPFCQQQTDWNLDDIDGWIASVSCSGCDMVGPMSEFKYDDPEEAKVDAFARWQRAFPPAADAGEVRERPAKLTMPNGDVLECEYPNGTDWAKSWSIRYPTTGTTGEQDWEIVETYGLTAIANAILALPQAPSPTFEKGIATPFRNDARRETGWLIEWRDGLGQTNWLRLYEPEMTKDMPLFHCVGGTLNAGEALRFARKCDARSFLHLVRDTWPDAIVTDHEWISREEAHGATD